MIQIGIDPGTHTGFAVWDDREQKFIEMETMSIHRAIAAVMEYRYKTQVMHEELMVIFEDARQRTWFGRDKNTNAKLQGAGSIKRDCSIWEDFLKDYSIPFRAVPPMKGGTKLTSGYFKMLSGWEGKTSNHARDAAMLVIGR